MQEAKLVGVEIDKCSENFSIRIPEILKVKLDNLSAPQKTLLKEQILLVMAKHIHNSLFDPAQYLSTKDL